MSLEKLFDRIGRKRISAALGVTSATIAGHERAGVAPASWFDIIEKMAGCKVDRGLFKFASGAPANGCPPGQGVDWRRVIELAGSGARYHEINAKTGISPRKITTVCQIAGIEPREMSGLSLEERKAATAAAIKRWQDRV